MPIIDIARDFALNAHHGQMRKLSSEPYFVHLENVADILKEANFDDEVVAAGYLHDVLEDTNVTLREIKKLFGENVAHLILGNTENKELSWEERKRHTIESVKFQEMNIKALVAADKLDNITSLIKGIDEKGEDVWVHFKRGRKQQAWYYKGVVTSVFAGLDQSENIIPKFFYELKEKVELLFGT